MAPQRPNPVVSMAHARESHEPPHSHHAEERLRSAYSALPSVEAVFACRDASAFGSYSRQAALSAIREAIQSQRDRIRAGDVPPAGETSAVRLAEDALAIVRERSRARLRRVVNATGVVLHTNLGRSRLARAALEAVTLAATSDVNLEYDLAVGARGERDSLVEEHLQALTGAEAATVVNNNAAAVFLALNTLACGREVLVSRGELIEIGGSFRIPDIMAASGARLREVGTTNRTHLPDYANAIGPETALVMKVHASNYRIVGFSSSVELPELAALASEHPDVFVIEDLGAGAILELESFGLAAEPLVGERLRAGADLVLASGDKLLGGPQCGIIAGRRDLVERLRRNPLKRALRCDKLTLAALEATLRLYRFSTAPEREIPTLRYMTRPVEELRAIGEQAIELLTSRLGDRYSFSLQESSAQAGSGSQPDRTIASVAIAVRGAAADACATERMFRSADPPILGRIEKDVFLLDVRVVDDPSDLVPNVFTA